MKQRLSDKVCIITGGAQGIGKAGALQFVSDGAKVIIVDVNDEAGAAAAKEVGGACEFMHADVSRSADVKAVIDAVRAKHGKLHVIYNNASVFLPGRDGRITDVSEATWAHVLGINLTSIYNFCHFGIPLIIESAGGAVINTASSAGVIGIPGCDVYTASKGATVSLTRSMAVEYGPQGVRVNCIAPAGIRTPMLAQSNLTDTTFDEERFLALRTPVRRFGTPEEIARVAAFLASDDSSYVNGAVIVADGGITIDGDLSRIAKDYPAKS